MFFCFFFRVFLSQTLQSMLLKVCNCQLNITWVSKDYWNLWNQLERIPELKHEDTPFDFCKIVDMGKGVRVEGKQIWSLSHFVYRQKCWYVLSGKREPQHLQSETDSRILAHSSLRGKKKKNHCWETVLVLFRIQMRAGKKKPACTSTRLHRARAGF